jgi:anti-sigma B factor antagonist
MDGMTLDIHTTGTVLRVAVRGEVDLSSRDRLLEALTVAIATTAKPIEVDLSQVTFLDAAGIGALIAAHTNARNHRLTLSVYGAAGLVRQVLEITGAAKVLAAHADPATPGNHRYLWEEGLR